MLFARWFRNRRPTPTFRPALMALEDRTVPSGVGHSTSGPAAHLQVVVPQNVQSGQSFQVKVEATDSSNRLATGYNGTVTFSLPGDTADTPPASYTFTTRDHGIHFFQLTLTNPAQSSQTQEIDVSGTPSSTVSTPALTASATTTVQPAPTLTQLLVITPEQATVGAPARVTVEALDGSGHLLRNFTGTITLQTSDSAATGLPSGGTYTFTTSDHGKHTFQITFGTADSGDPLVQTTVTATDGSVSGQASLTVNPAPTLSQLLVKTVEQTVTGTPTRVTVQALDASGHLLKNFTGTITLTTSDGAATGLPSGGTYTFTASDRGQHTFQITFGTVDTGTPPTPTTVTAADGSITNTASVTVFDPTTVTGFRFNSGFLGFGRMDAPFSLGFALNGVATKVTVTAVNAIGQPVTGYTGTVAFTSSDTTATISDSKSGTQTALGSFTYQFTTGTTADNGSHTFWVTFGTNGQQTLTVTDQSTQVAGTDNFWVIGGHILPPTPAGVNNLHV